IRFSAVHGFIEPERTPARRAGSDVPGVDPRRGRAGLRCQRVRGLEDASGGLARRSLDADALRELRRKTWALSGGARTAWAGAPRACRWRLAGRAPGGRAAPRLDRGL